MGCLMEVVITGICSGQNKFSKPALFVGLHVMVLLFHGRTVTALILCSVVPSVTKSCMV